MSSGRGNKAASRKATNVGRGGSRGTSGSNAGPQNQQERPGSSSQVAPQAAEPSDHARLQTLITKLEGSEPNRWPSMISELQAELTKANIVFPSAVHDPRRRLFYDIRDSVETILLSQANSDPDRRTVQRWLSTFVQNFESPFEDYYPWIFSLTEQSKNGDHFKNFFYSIFMPSLEKLLEDPELQLTPDNVFYLRTKFRAHLTVKNLPNYEETAILVKMVEIGLRQPSFWNDYFLEFITEKVVPHILSFRESIHHEFLIQTLITPLSAMFRKLYSQTVQILEGLCKRLSSQFEDIKGPNTGRALQSLALTISLTNSIFSLVTDLIQEEYSTSSPTRDIVGHMNSLQIGVWFLISNHYEQHSFEQFVLRVKDFLMQFNFLGQFMSPDVFQRITSKLFTIDQNVFLCRLAAMSQREDFITVCFSLLLYCLDIVCDSPSTLSNSVDFSALIDALFSPEVQSLRHTMNYPEIEDCLRKLVARLLGVKHHAVSIATSIYEHIINDLGQAIGALKLKQFDSGQELKFIESKSTKSCSIAAKFYEESPSRCYTSISFNLSLLLEFVNCENAVICSYALQPNVVELVLQEFSPFIVALATDAKESEAATFMSALFAIIKKYEFFILTALPTNQTLKNPEFLMKELLTIEPAELISLKPKQDSSETAQASAPKPFNKNAQHLRNILKFYSRLLSIPNLNEVTELALEHVGEIFEKFFEKQAFPMFETMTAEINELFAQVAKHSFYSTNFQTLELSSMIMERFFTSFAGEKYSEIISVYRAACLKNVCDFEPDLCRSFLKMKSFLPGEKSLLDVLAWKNLKTLDESRHEACVYPEIAHLAKIVTMNKYAGEGFFEGMFQFVLDATFFGQKPLGDLTELFNQFVVLKKPDFKLEHDVKDTISYFPFIDFKGLDNYKSLSQNVSIALNWLGWQFVFHAMENRLKTSFGSPQELFKKLSLRITEMLDEPTTPEQLEEALPTEVVVSVRMTLNILESFSKAMFHASSRGRSTWLMDFSTKTKIFFKKNFGTCKDWMNRNRRSIMIIALRVGDYGIVIRNGEELLRDYVRDTSILSVEQIKFLMILIVKAALELKAPDIIRGYGVWLKKLYSINVEWIDAATYEASGRFEQAIDHYGKLVFDNRMSSSGAPKCTTLPCLFARDGEFKCDTFSADFVRERSVQCFLALGAYEEAKQFKKNNPIVCQGTIFGDFDLSYLCELNKYDFVKEHSSPQVQEEPTQLWDVQACYHSTQQSLLGICDNARKAQDYFAHQECLEQMQDLFDQKLTPLISAAYLTGGTAETLPISRLHRMCMALHNWIEQGVPSFISEFFKSHNNRYSLEDCVFTLQWLRIFRSFSWSDCLDPIELDLLLEISKLARKSGNLKLARKSLLKYQSMKFNCMDFEDLMKKPFTDGLFQYINESSQMVMAEGDADDAFDILTSTFHAMLERFQFYPKGVIDQRTAEECAKVSILLADYVENEPRLINGESEWFLQLHSFKTIQTYFEQIDPRGLGRGASELWAESDVRCTGSLLLRAVNTCKNISGAWNRLADWSYKWARRLDDARNAKMDSRETRMRTLSEDCEPQTRCYYELAANSYFKYLQLSSESVENVNATLRLLRLILKHAHQLKESIELGLKSTPTQPWKRIALQLFSRLNHHEAYVRKSITDLLCRIGDDDAQLLIFPATAGVMNNKSIKTEEFDYSKEEISPDEDSEDEEEVHNTQQCYKILMQHLEQDNPKMVAETKCFVDELRRITILWDELWIGTLQNNLNEVVRQVANLEREIELAKGNANLFPNEKELFIKEKHQIYFRRILYTLELTKSLTSEKPETTHESWFQKAFWKQIDELIDVIKNPESYWEPQNISYYYQTALQSIRKQSIVAVSHRLEMHDVSPILSSLKSTNIPIPGRVFGAKVSIHKINNTVTILQTLTKPKKMTFVGSDGRLYPHLFKGHEDLHLDERIMQFLSIVNLIMSNCDELSSQKHLLSRARHYSVTPLGNKSGLIEWVSGAQPLYRFYNRWLSSMEFQDILQESTAKVSPVELFRQKLGKYNMTVENRSEWSEMALGAIHEELRKETPNDLLYKELWAASMSGIDYWSLSQNYMNSCALMSMVGYLLGLGDRHLDNILLDLTTGELIHIDYNICFEKGKSLKVPEKVPCRLTANIVYALGVTGTDGNFRFACESILKMMRKNREMLLTLLEAFVYDPLVDWTPEHEEGYTGAIYGGMRIAQLAAEGKIIPRKQMERENSEAMARLNELMATADLRQVEWPEINMQEQIDLIRDGELILPKAQASAALQDGETRKLRRNAYAISVWKRIKNKFDGRKIVAGDEMRFSVAEQVGHVIAQSIDQRNLARMYEGWTSWV